MLSDLARIFFEAEIACERDRTDSPATIGSAIRHVEQQPHAILTRRPSAKVVSGMSASTAARALRAELAGLQDEFGNRFRLQELLDLADQEPIRFTCPTCGGHVLEQVQTDVIVISRIAGRLPREQIFIQVAIDFGDHNCSPYFRCGGCQETVADDDDRMHEILDAASRQEET